MNLSGWKSTRCERGEGVFHPPHSSARATRGTRLQTGEGPGRSVVSQLHGRAVLGGGGASEAEEQRSSGPKRLGGPRGLCGGRKDGEAARLPSPGFQVLVVPSAPGELSRSLEAGRGDPCPSEPGELPAWLARSLPRSRGCPGERVGRPPRDSPAARGRAHSSFIYSPVGTATSCFAGARTPARSLFQGHGSREGGKGREGLFLRRLPGACASTRASHMAGGGRASELARARPAATAVGERSPGMDKAQC